MSPVSYTHTVREGEEDSLTLHDVSGSTTINSTHPNWDAVWEAIDSEDYEEAIRLSDISAEAATNLEPLSERVSISNGRVYFDDEEQDNAVANQVARLVSEGKNQEWIAVVRFMEKLATNPNEDSRNQLYGWLNACDFSLTTQGDIIGYKGVTLRNGEFASIQSGNANVDGVPHKGQIPNVPGTVITMPRGNVNHDPSQGCSTGLHVGTYDFAKSFSGSGITLGVIVNPRDVVSVPSDASQKKCRVSRYKVWREVISPYTSPVVELAYY